jgi:hypothetical protein
MVKRTLVTLMALGMFSGVALAAPPAFEDVDRNKDGAITADEAAGVEGLDMASADANGDGMLSKQEYEAAAKKL